MPKDTKQMVCFRLPPEERAAVDQYCVEHNVTVTDLYRGLTSAFLSGTLSPGSIEGFKAGRATAIQLASAALAQTLANLPETLEEAAARGLVI